MNNSQRFVFTSLLLVLALEFGSFSKLQSLWQLAFSPSGTNGNSNGSDPGTSSPFNPATKPGSLPAPPAQNHLHVNKTAFQKDSAQLQWDLTLGNFNPDIPDQWNALNANFAVQGDVDKGASYAQTQKDMLALQQALNKLNDPMYNTDYQKLFADLGL